MKVGKMRRFALYLLAALLLLPLLQAARPAGPVILVDLAHGENTRGLCLFMKMMPEAYWEILVPSKNYQLPPCSVKPYKVLVGDFSSRQVVEALKEVDAVIIGQPTQYFTKAELKEIANWFKSTPGKVLWCAGDSDYPAQGGNMEVADHACDAVFEAVGAKIRLDFVSVEDVNSNAGRAYRVIGIVKPDPRYDAQIIAYGAHKVLFHGPGAVAWVDKNGNWHKLTDPNTPKNIIKIVVTSNGGRIVEHQPVAPGAPGEFGKAHHVGETGVFVLMGAEVIGNKPPYSVIIASGESPYGGYQPMDTFRYHGIPLDGPRFVRNVMLWSLSYPAELGIAQQLNNNIMHVEAQVAKVAQIMPVTYAAVAIAVIASALALFAILG
ncbi:ABC transporter [Ignicoccus pacificus DSM 13166]|uniref:ABC transporter n=1 Tax=Ignicoccus pacificus DSM 13166 TaxID=940294 RepID=A0A977PKB5_9CREN|nr:ABC transporter [Ignicoccus pacificus DSM 13166]